MKVREMTVGLFQSVKGVKVGRKEELIEQYKMFILPVENTYISESDRSEVKNEDGKPLFSTMFGLYCNEPFSHSCFHKLENEEIWTFLEGDSIELYLLYEDGSVKKVVLGADIENGEVRQFVVPRGVWQGGCLSEGGEYGFYKCTVVPAFAPDIFEAGIKEELTAKYPEMAGVIDRLNDNGDEKFMQ